MNAKDENAFEHLRRADPARGLAADSAAVRAQLDKATASDLSADTLVYESPGRRSAGRSRAWLAVAASTALITGVGGFVVGQAINEPGSSSEVASAEPAGGFESLVDSVLGTQEHVTESSYTSGPYGGESVALTGDENLPAEGGTGEAFTYQAAGGSDEEVLASAAEALNVQGEVVEDFDQLLVNDGGVSLYSYSFGPMSSFGYDNRYVSPSCEQNIADEALYLEEFPEELEGSNYPVLDPEQCEEVSDDLTDAEALAMAEEFVAAFGLSTNPDSIRVDRYDGVVSVNGELAQGSDGSAGMYASFYVDVTTGGVANGNVDTEAERVSLGEYPLLAPNQIVERQSDPVLGRISIEPETFMEDEFWESYAGDDVPLPPKPIAGQPLPIIGATSDIESYELAMGTYYPSWGAPYVVPIYDVTTIAGQHVYVLALADEAIDLLE